VPARASSRPWPSSPNHGRRVAGAGGGRTGGGSGGCGGCLAGAGGGSGLDSGSVGPGLIESGSVESGSAGTGSAAGGSPGMAGSGAILHHSTDVRRDWRLRFGLGRCAPGLAPGSARLKHLGHSWGAPAIALQLGRPSFSAPARASAALLALAYQRPRPNRSDEPATICRPG
jgi:hypothetical protein